MTDITEEALHAGLARVRAFSEQAGRQLGREAAEWTDMLARDGIRFEEQPVTDPAPPLYFWLGKDAAA